MNVKAFVSIMEETKAFSCFIIVIYPAFCQEQTDSNRFSYIYSFSTIVNKKITFPFEIIPVPHCGNHGVYYEVVLTFPIIAIFDIFELIEAISL